MFLTEERLSTTTDCPSQQLTSAGPDLLADMEQWHLACRIAASKRLSKSDRLPRFLLYICEQTLTGNADIITEQRIGTHIFNRPTDYNPGEDNIVRSYARMLRKRLDEYFDSEGSHEPLRMTIPRGGYIPLFAVNANARPARMTAPNPTPEAPEAFEAPATLPPPTLPPPQYPQLDQLSQLPAAPPTAHHHLLWITGLVCLFLGGCLGAFAWWATHNRAGAPAQEQARPASTKRFQQVRAIGPDAPIVATRFYS